MLVPKTHNQRPAHKQADRQDWASINGERVRWGDNGWVLVGTAVLAGRTWTIRKALAIVDPQVGVVNDATMNGCTRLPNALQGCMIQESTLAPIADLQDTARSGQQSMFSRHAHFASTVQVETESYQYPTMASMMSARHGTKHAQPLRISTSRQHCA